MHVCFLHHFKDTESPAPCGEPQKGDTVPRDSSSAEDCPTASWSLVFTTTLTFNGVLVILDVGFLTVAVQLQLNESRGINFNKNSHSTDISPVLLKKSPSSTNAKTDFFFFFFKTWQKKFSFLHQRTPPPLCGSVITLVLLPLLGVPFRWSTIIICLVLNFSDF